MNKYLKVFLIVLIVVLTVPRAINAGFFGNYRAVKEDYIRISNQELLALDYLRSKTDPSSVVLVDPHIELDFDTPYVSYLGNRYMFLSGRGDELGAHGINFTKRAKIVDTILYDTRKSVVKKQLDMNHITYLYLLSTTKLPLKNIHTMLTPVFKNSQITIFKVLP